MEPLACGWRPRRKRLVGFSLIEVLVAVAILATGLIAASRAALVATSDQGVLRDRTLARWVAHNVLAEIRLQPQQAAAGTQITKAPPSESAQPEQNL